jgi:hypothetical protein
MGIVRLQAAVMGYADLFLMLMVLYLGLAAFGLIMKRPKRREHGLLCRSTSRRCLPQVRDNAEQSEPCDRVR